jgi:peptidoglycan/LPS O-acetylase OafA/YrhL
MLTSDLNIEFHQILSELFYLQSYLPGIWLHTWTLAVEEHFYLLFSITLFLITRKQLLEKRNIIIGSLVLLLILSFSMRFYISYPHRDENLFVFMQTHLRSDGIILGVLASYLLNFTKFKLLYQKRKWLLACISILLIAPGFYFKGGAFFMNTFGLTLVNTGFAIIVLLSLDLDELFEKRLSPFARSGLKVFSFIGVNSYSIYLWHLNSKSISSSMVSSNSNFGTLTYIATSIILGIAMSYLIEKPFLKIRDYIFNKITLYKKGYKKKAKYF